MNFLRKTALVLIAPIFFLLLFATAFDMGVLRVVNQPSNVKQILIDSGVYKTAVNSLLDQAKQINDSNDGGGSISLSDPTIRAAANATFTPQYLQTNTETVIDSVYAWLNGKTAQPDFSIDLTNAKAQFASTVAQAVQTRAASLPSCTAANTPSEFDGLSTTCLPHGVTPAAAGGEVQGQIVGGKGFLDNLVINADTIKSKGSNQSVFASGKLKSAPKQYQRAKETPIILAVATLLVALVIVFLNTNRRKGLRHVGIILVVIGLFMLAFAWGLNYVVTQKAIPKINLNNAVVQTNVRSLIIDITQKVDHNYWLFGGLYAVLGVLAISAAIMWGSKGTHKDKDELEGEGKTKADRIDLKEPDKATSLTADTKAAPKPAAKKNIKVQ